MRLASRVIQYLCRVTRVEEAALRKDNSKRTMRIKTPYRVIIAAAVCMLVSVVWMGAGALTYNDVVAKSSSPIGTKLEFGRSGATISISDIYTDEAKSCLIVRFSGDDSEMLKLPYKGTDYHVFLQADVYDGMEETSVLFGKMSTDGDMFLVIPSPTDDVYSVILRNDKYVAGGQSSSSLGSSASSSAPSLDDSESLAKALSQYKYDDTADDRKGVVQLPSDSYDAVGFRVTLDPAFKNDDAYRAKVLPGKLLSDDGQFDFEKFFNAAFKDASIDTLNAEHDSLMQQKEQLEDRKAELDERIADNPSDNAAISAASDVESQLKQINSRMKDIAEQITSYSEMSYSDDLFKNLQTKAIVLNGVS